MAGKRADKKRYRVLVGVDYPPGRRAEPGDVVDDLPERSIKWLVDQGVVAPVDEQPDDPGDGG